MLPVLRLIIIAVLFISPTAFAQDEYENNVDPWEGFNRKIFAFNDVADRYLLKPAAKGYQFVLPQIVDDGVSNIFNNLGEVITFVNSILQFKPKKTAITTGRFLINSTVGLLGFFDVAQKMGLEYSPEDFGQTFAHWGVSAGPYLVLPILGSSTLRDTAGLVPDTLAYPTAFIEHISTRNASTVVRKLDDRADLLKAEEVMFGDKYTFIRDAYLQNREYLIKDGVVEDDFGDEDFDEDYGDEY